MIRVFYTYFLVFLMLWPVWRTGLVWAWFMVNRSYIAQELCINRDKPELTCNGKCFLSFQLKATPKDGDKQVAHGVEDLMGKTLSFDFQHPSLAFFTPKASPLNQHKDCFSYQIVVLSPLKHALFRPPVA